MHAHEPAPSASFSQICIHMYLHLQAGNQDTNQLVQVSTLPSAQLDSATSQGYMRI